MDIDIFVNCNDIKIYYHRNDCKNLNTKSDTAKDYVSCKNHTM